MSVQVTAETTLGHTEDPLANPDLMLSDHIEQTRDAVLDRIPVATIVADARAAHPHEFTDARAEAMSLVYRWFHTHVDDSGFDPDVLTEARRQVYETVLFTLSNAY